MNDLKRSSTIALEIMTVFLFLVFLFPIFLVFINAGKNPFAITANPLSLPEDWFQVFRNMGIIWSDPNLRYGSSFFASMLITVFSLLFIVLVAGQAAWVLVRTKTKLSQIIFFLFVAAMVIPFQIVMLPIVSWFRIVAQATGIQLLRS
ncbi:MAG: carbohydrate ABC transporter permease, partial [Spirochaetales bacterium]|nr:carbohydrate ABC transporter permease [Spirochaetales bacterium]